MHNVKSFYVHMNRHQLYAFSQFIRIYVYLNGFVIMKRLWRFIILSFVEYIGRTQIQYSVLLIFYPLSLIFINYTVSFFPRLCVCIQSHIFL